MALTPAQRHRIRVLAEKAQAVSPFGIEMLGSEYQLMLAKLTTDKRTLKGLESIQLKRQTKAQLLPAYLPWIESAVTKGQGARDDVLTTVMVWAIDAGAYSLALRIAAYVLHHKLPLPDQYHRSTAAVLLDEFSDAYLQAQWSPLKPEDDGAGSMHFVPDEGPAVSFLLQVDALTAGWDAPDQARAKLYKATAYAVLGKVQTAETPELDKLPADAMAAALALLTQALALDAMSGVKKDIERIERKQRAMATGRAVEALAKPAQEAEPPKAAAPTQAKRTTTKQAPAKSPPTKTPASRKR